jgi:hypothetical protein
LYFKKEKEKEKEKEKGNGKHKNETRYSSNNTEMRFAHHFMYTNRPMHVSPT